MKKLLSMFAVLTLLASCGETTTEKECQDSTKACCDTAVVQDSATVVTPTDSAKSDSATH
jgi:hypothetical protein